MNPTELRRALLSWYDGRKRAMPWRDQVSPYRTWISEIMLQQTTVAAVAPRFESFVAEFPDAASLAAAPEEKVLRAWAGLGYYSRARNLRLAAQKIVSEHGGVVPDTLEAVLALPGVGRYTAGAILSIAYGKPEPLVDGNVARVFARLFAIEGDIKAPETLKLLWSKAESLVDKRRPGDWNQSLMELGATVCAPENPKCGECPAASLCEAKKLGRENSLPVMPERPDFVPVRWTCLWIEKKGEVLLMERQRGKELLGGLWGLPESAKIPDAEVGDKLGAVTGSVTHHKIEISLYAAKVAAKAKLPRASKWVPAGEVSNYLISSLWLKAALAASSLAPVAAPAKKRAPRAKKPVL